MKTEVVLTNDGSHTLFLPEMNEQYHSLNGAITESKHVYIEKGFNYWNNKNAIVFEVGFGTGLNTLLTAIEAKKTKKYCLYYTIEKYPLDLELIKKLNYGKLISKEAENCYMKIHEAEWSKTTQINEYFSVYKIEGDLKTFIFNEIPLFGVIYFDAFGPEKQPEMWTNDIFRKMADQTSENGVIVTYSAKGEVRRQLQNAGFEMERLPGPPGKKQMLRGIKWESFT